MPEECLSCGMPAQYRIHLGVMKIEICHKCLEGFKMTKLKKQYHPRIDRKEAL